jgi:hypothetical protein
LSATTALPSGVRGPGSGAFLRIAAIGFNSTLAGHL